MGGMWCLNQIDQRTINNVGRGHVGRARIRQVQCPVSAQPKYTRLGTRRIERGPGHDTQWLLVRRNGRHSNRGLGVELGYERKRKLQRHKIAEKTTRRGKTRYVARRDGGEIGTGNIEGLGRQTTTHRNIVHGSGIANHQRIQGHILDGITRAGCGHVK